MELKVREVRRSDNEVLAKIIRAAFYEHNAPQQGTVFSDPTTDNLYELFRAEGAFLLVAETDGIIDGCCGIYPTHGLDKDCAELVKFYLRKESRGKGVGRELMNRCLDEAGKMGYKKIYLESLPEFDRAVTMYEKLGFKRLDKPMGVSGHCTCNIWMLKELD
ncbi:MAG: GNAT family N-acetyltransferase [Bacteroidales bacterium]